MHIGTQEVTVDVCCTYSYRHDIEIDPQVGPEQLPPYTASQFPPYMGSPNIHHCSRIVLSNRSLDPE